MNALQQLTAMLDGAHQPYMVLYEKEPGVRTLEIFGLAFRFNDDGELKKVKRPQNSALATLALLKEVASVGVFTSEYDGAEGYAAARKLESRLAELIESLEAP